MKSNQKVFGFCILLIIIFIIPSFPQTFPTLGLKGYLAIIDCNADDIHPCGDHLLFFVEIYKSGTPPTPLKNAYVFLNDIQIPEIRTGVYEKLIYRDISTIKRIEIAINPRTGIHQVAFPVATAKIDNIIAYTFPEPEGTIDLSSYGTMTSGLPRPILFKWNFSKALKKSMLRIYDQDTSDYVFQKILIRDYVKLSPKIFEPNKEYKIYQGTYDYGRFNLYRGAAPVSEIEIEYIYIQYFKTM